MDQPHYISEAKFRSCYILSTLMQAANSAQSSVKSGQLVLIQQVVDERNWPTLAASASLLVATQ